MAKKNLRILWHSVAPFIYSGYGNLTKNVALRLSQYYPFIISCYYGLHPGGSLVLAGTKVFPSLQANHGEYSVKHYIKKFKIDLPIVASDFWPFGWFSDLPNSLLYGPIDSDDYSPDDIAIMKNYSYFVPCSKFGGKVYRKLTKRKPFAIIPHGVDTRVYYPHNKKESRKLFNLPKNKFIIGTVSANSDPEPRKGWDDMLIALSDFFEEHPKTKKNTIYFAYTKPTDKRGLNLPEIARKLKLTKIVRFPEHLAQVVGIPDQEMAKLYSCFDFFLNASRREGFCLPVLEAQACGIPVVASNTSALPELVKNHGWLVKMGPQVFTARGWKCRKVDRDDLVKKIEDAYFNRELRRKYSQESVRFAKAYDWEKLIKKQWLPLLEKLEKKSLNKISSN